MFQGSCIYGGFLLINGGFNGEEKIILDDFIAYDLGKTSYFKTTR